MTSAWCDAKYNCSGTRTPLEREETEVPLWALEEFLEPWPVRGVAPDDLRRLSALELTRQLLPKQFALEAAEFFSPVEPDPLEPAGKEKFTATICAAGLLQLELHTEALLSNAFALLSRKICRAKSPRKVYNDCDPEELIVICRPYTELLRRAHSCCFGLSTVESGEAAGQQISCTFPKRQSPEARWVAVCEPLERLFPKEFPPRLLRVYYGLGDAALSCKEFTLPPQEVGKRYKPVPSIVHIPYCMTGLEVLGKLSTLGRTSHAWHSMDDGMLKGVPDERVLIEDSFVPKLSREGAQEGLSPMKKARSPSSLTLFSRPAATPTRESKDRRSRPNTLGREARPPGA